MSFKPLSTVEIPPKSEHKYSIIWMHGLGADGHDFESLVPELRLNGMPHIRFIFPNAPIQPVTINGGMSMRSWYDITDMSVEHSVNIDDIYRSADLITPLIREEIGKGIPSTHILLAGFSQGGALALHIGLRLADRLAGIVSLSAYLPTSDQLKNEQSKANDDTPIFMGHGIIDPVVSIESAKKTFDTLSAMNYKIEWHDYVMEHSLCIEEIDHLSEFINSVFA